MPQLQITINIEKAEGVDADAVHDFYDLSVTEIPKDAIARIASGWQVEVREVEA